MLCELETDKVSVEVPAPAAGVLAEIFAEEGSTVEASATLAVLTTGAGAAAPRAKTLNPVPVLRLRPSPPTAKTSKTRLPPKRRWPKRASAAIRSQARAAMAV